MQNYSYKNSRAILLLAVFVLTASFGYAQTDSTKSFSEPTIYVGNKILILEGGEIDKDTLLKYPFMSVKSDDGTEWNIMTYVVYTTVNGVEGKPIRVNDGKFPDQIISLIRTAPSGTVLEFTDIRIQSVAGTRTIVVPLMVMIK